MGKKKATKGSPRTGQRSAVKDLPTRRLRTGQAGGIIGRPDHGNDVTVLAACAGLTCSNMISYRSTAIGGELHVKAVAFFAIICLCVPTLAAAQTGYLHIGSLP